MGVELSVGRVCSGVRVSTSPLPPECVKREGKGEKLGHAVYLAVLRISCPSERT